MKKVIEFATKREISYVNITKELCAYREEIYVGGKLENTSEDIANLVDLENVVCTEPIKNSRLKLYDKGVIEFSRNNLLFQNYEDIERLVIKKPYKYIIEEGLEDVVNLDFYTYDSNVYDIDGNKCAKAFHLDYISGIIDSNNYDLEKSLEILRKRSDIHLYNDKIEKVPYYNADHLDHKCLSFKWMPSDEDFSKLGDLNSFEVYECIAKEILKLPTVNNID